MASDTYTVSKPQSWDKAVFAAFLRMIGHTQDDAANIAGVGSRTLARWEVSEFWPDAQDEASKDRWLRHLIHAARRGLSTGVIADGNLALKVLERTDDRFLPPAQRLEHGGVGGEAIEVAVTRKVIRAPTNRVAEHMTNGKNGDGRS